VSDSWFKGAVKRVRQAVLVLLLVAAGVHLAWSLLAPAIPILVSLAIVLTVLWVAVGGRITS
jgi:hypothetical protein